MCPTIPLTPLNVRAVFLEAVATAEPKVLQSLGVGPYSAWLEYRKNLETVQAVNKSLHVWAEVWHLIDPWCDKWARATLEWWQSQDNGQLLEWCPVSHFF